MNVRPYSPADWERLCVIHDAARRHELEAAGLADAFLSLEQTAGNEPALALYRSEGFVILRRSDGRLTGNEAFAASGYLLQRTASEAEPDVGYDCSTST
jgi:ribosomal protein S18 acetylase RimI-like enzyme